MIMKRGSVYWYKFKWSIKCPDGTREHFVIRRTTRSSNKKDAMALEGGHRRALAMGEVHPRDPWPRPASPTAIFFRDFATNRFSEHCESHTRPKTRRFYAQAIVRLLKSSLISDIRLTGISTETVSKYVASRRARFSGNSISTINADLRTLRRILNLAEEWGVIPRAPSIHELPGAKGRDRVITPEEEVVYLREADPSSPLRDATILAVDTGLRPNSELFLLEWCDVSLEGTSDAAFGVLHVRNGKTSSAERVVPFTPRAQEVLIRRKQTSTSRYVFPGSGTQGHLMSIKHAHDGVIKRAKLRPFPFYCWRHTFGTRCAESGMDRFSLARLMGHSSPSVAERYYIHVTSTHISTNFEKFLAYHSQLAIGSFPGSKMVQ